MNSLCFFVVFFAVCGASLGAYAQTRVSIVGCYSDVTPIPEGEIVGTGSFWISKRDGSYRARFAELISDSGEHATALTVSNLRVNKRTGQISFDLPLNRGGHPVVIPHVSGKITKNGIKMYWRGDHGEYGNANPFLRRRTRKCD